MSEFLLIFSIGVAPWVLAGWFRLPRYVGYFQRQDYNINHYSSLLMSSRSERRYFTAFIALIMILFFVFACPFTALGSLTIKYPVVVIGTYLVPLIIAILFVPRRLLRETNYRREPRTIRLLIIAFWLELIPVLIALGIMLAILSMIFDPNNSPESMILAFGLIHFVFAFGVCAGPISFALTPFSVFFGHYINRLIETAIIR